MTFLEILLIAVGLAMDALAVSVAAGAGGQARGGRASFRLSFHFGLFQFMMPVAGWFAGRGISPLIAAVDHWVAFGLLALVGIRMIRAETSLPTAPRRANPSRGWSLIALSLATSIDALAVGLSLAVLRVQIWYPCFVIGVVTGGLSLLGVRLGHRLGLRFGKRLETVGGLMLLLIGLRILVQHLRG